MQDNLDMLLESRSIPQPRAGLARDIAAQALGIKQRTSTTYARPNWLSRLLEKLALPQPAYALGFSLMLGLVISGQLYDTQFPDSEDTLQNLLYLEENL